MCIRDRRWLERPNEMKVKMKVDGLRVSFRSNEIIGSSGTQIQMEATISDDKTISMTVTSPSHLRHIFWLFTKVPKKKEGLITKKESVAEPPGDYTVQPNNQGDLVWLSGPPGAGKSTIAALISKMMNYVYYEADAFHKGVNPFVPDGGDEDDQHSLIGQGMKQRKRVVVDGYRNWGIKVDNASTGYDQDSLDKFYRAMAGDIKTQKLRIGGDWVVAFAVPDKDDRDTI